MLALLALLAAVSPEPLPAAPPLSPPPRAVRVVEVRLNGLETRLRADAPPSRFRDLAKVLVERAHVRLAAGDTTAADQLVAAASDTLRADGPLVLILRSPEDAPGPRPPFVVMPPRAPGGPPDPHDPFGPATGADRAARRLDHAATMLAMTAGFAGRGDAAKLLGLARTALDDARKALAANDARSADGGARRAETLARAALHAAIADDPSKFFPPGLPPLPHHLPPPGPPPPGELP
jgi:hypothetical protein